MVKPKSLGHVVLRVRELARAESFYTKILSLDVQAKIDDKMVFLTSNTESSHELALLEIGRDAPGPNPDGVGLYHTAWRYSSLEELRKLHKTLIENSIESGIGNHGISLGIYFFDPDGNEIEAYYELPKTYWPKENIFSGDYFPNGLDTELNILEKKQ